MRRRLRLAAALRSVGSGGLDLDTRAPVMVPLFQKPKCGSSIDASSPGKRDKQNRLDATRVSPAFATAHLTPVPRGPHVIPNARPSRRRRQRAHEARRFLHKVGEACQRECTVAVPAARSGRSSLRNSPCAPPTRSVAASTLLPRFRYLDQADGRGRTATLKTRDPCSLSELNARKVEFGSAEIVFANELRLSQNFGTGAGCILHLIFFTRLH